MKKRPLYYPMKMRRLSQSEEAVMRAFMNGGQLVQSDDEVEKRTAKETHGKVGMFRYARAKESLKERGVLYEKDGVLIAGVARVHKRKLRKIA